MSSPARGTWIEICSVPEKPFLTAVVPRKGDVDRNDAKHLDIIRVRVVPRKGDVDRNVKLRWMALLTSVSSPARGTWIEIHRLPRRCGTGASSPARGTWIEIDFGSDSAERIRSSPARGTWIEIKGLA